MLIGAGIGFGLSLPFQTAGNFIDPWSRSGPVIRAIIGAVAGLCFELFTRLNSRAKRRGDGMSDELKRRSRWRTWAMAALLVYLWGWLAGWLLADFIDDTGPLVSILRFAYWPLVKLGELWFRMGFRPW
jgi:hypothetical protein